MNASSFLAAFPRQLRYWTLHCLLNSAPSFCIAVNTLWVSSTAIKAMLCSISTFILLYATLTSLNGPLRDKNHVLSRSLKLGANIRAWISGLSLFVVFTPAMQMTPDFWCGRAAVHAAFQLFGSDVDMYAGFLPVYITTLLEGFILSFILMMISFFAVIFLQSRDRRRLFSDPDFCRLVE